MRRRALSEGWYPDSKDEIQNQIEAWERENHFAEVPSCALAGVVPHAGWSYCGSMIASVLRASCRRPHTVVVLGGHNPSGGALVSYSDTRWKFPTGVLERNTVLTGSLEASLNDAYEIVNEYTADNTVEVVMAMASALYPEALWAAWRIPADSRALDFGDALHKTVLAAQKPVLVLGSTDLTHYGPGFHFTPPESLDNPPGWAAAKDAEVLKALQEFDGIRALELGNRHGAACSSGGAVAAMAYARAAGALSGRILEYRSSRDVQISDTFVGYGSLIWE